MALLLALACAGGCENGRQAADAPAEQSCPRDGLQLPEGFCASVVADNLGFVRHIALGPDGRLYVTLRNQRLGLGGLLMLSDEDGDGRFERLARVNEEPGMGIAVGAEYLYFGAESRVLRYPFLPGGGVGPAQVVVDGLPAGGRHAGKTLALDAAGALYVNIGAPGNACQQQEDVPGSPGVDPCPALERQAAIWRFPPGARGLRFPHGGTRYAGGIRNAYALDWNRALDALYAVQHGRDGLHELWPHLYDEMAGATLPAEVMLRLDPGSVHGWPYCYFDPRLARHVLAPEYGGDGQRTDRCGTLAPPVVAFPAHYSPHDLLFYDGRSFPARYRGGAFIAFHGSYNRGPLEQVGYQVAFVPARAGAPGPGWEIFADGFAGVAPVRRPEDAEHRPTGLALGGDGALFISDSVQGRIWRVWYHDTPARSAAAQVRQVDQRR